jgi:hypothetical protein
MGIGCRNSPFANIFCGKSLQQLVWMKTVDFWQGQWVVPPFPANSVDSSKRFSINGNPCATSGSDNDGKDNFLSGSGSVRCFGNS